MTASQGVRLSPISTSITKSALANPPSAKDGGCPKNSRSWVSQVDQSPLAVCTEFLVCWRGPGLVVGKVRAAGAGVATAAKTCCCKRADNTGGNGLSGMCL